MNDRMKLYPYSPEDFDTFADYEEAKASWLEDQAERVLDHRQSLRDRHNPDNLADDMYRARGVRI